MSVLPGLEEAVQQVTLNRALSQWHTPDPLAQRIVEWSGIHLLGRLDGTARILEPSAGGGAFLRALARAGDGFRGHVDAVSLDPAWALKLRAPPFPQLHLSVEQADYLTRGAPLTRYDATIMNPPYENGLDGLFLAKTMDESERVVALIRTVALCGDDRYKRVWSRCNDDGDYVVRKLAHLGLRPDFGGPHGASIDFSVVFLARRGVDERSPIEWWSR